jgi:hypothetical protein
MMGAIDSLELFWVRAGGRPLLLCLLVLAGLIVFDRICTRRTSNAAWSTWVIRLIAPVAISSLTAFTAIAVWYTSVPQFSDDAEPTMTAVGWLFHVGRPIYHALDSAERYSHIYGPVTFIVQGLVLGWLGPSIVLSKSVGSAAALGSLAVVYATVRRHASAKRAIVLTGGMALALLCFRQYSFWTRPDPLELFCVSVALLMATARSELASAIGVGIASGLMWNLKFTGPLYTLPIFVVMFWRHRPWATIAAGIIGALVTVAPFVAFDNVSFTQYVSWIRLSADTGLELALLRQDLEWAAFLCLPLFISLYAVPPEQRRRNLEWGTIVGSLLLAVALISIAGAKVGGGPYHLFPFLPILTYLTALHLENPGVVHPQARALPLATLAVLLVAAALGGAQQVRLFRMMRPRTERHEAADIQRFAEGHTGVIDMGYGVTEWMTLERPILVFRSNSYLLDQPAVGQYQLGGLPLPRATIEAVRSCRVAYWLIPKGEQPFMGRSEVTSALLYSDEFRAVFHETYRAVGSTDYYDVWQCQAANGAGPRR